MVQENRTSTARILVVQQTTAYRLDSLEKTFLANRIDYTKEIEIVKSRMTAVESEIAP